MTRRWAPYVVLLVLFGAVAALTGGSVRAAAAALLVVGIVFSIRQRIRDVALALGLVILLIIAALATTLTIDLGPSLRARAEREGSRLIERPMHIGKLGIHLWSGRFIVENLVIEGLKPTDRRFFTAKRIAISMPWWLVLRTREFLIESIEMTDWQMLVEMFDNGRHSFIKLPGTRSSGPRRFTTTLQWVHASRGQFTYIDHGTWSTVSPNLDVQVSHADGQYRGVASFTGGTVTIKDYLPMWSKMRCAFKIDGGKVHLDFIDIDSDGAKTRVVSGDVDFGNWPEQVYQVRSHITFPRMREIFFADETWRIRGEGDFAGVFHLFKGGHELKGDFTSRLAWVDKLEFPNLRGSLVWQPSRFEVFNASAGFYGGTTRFGYRIAPLGKPTPALARFEASYQDVDLAAFSDFLETKGIRLSGRASGTNVLEWPLGRFSDHRGEGRVSVVPPPGVALAGRLAAVGATSAAPAPEAAPADTNAPVARPLWRTPVGGELNYRFGPEWVDVPASRVATARTYVEFEGRTAYGERSTFDFHARSGDWQESDRVLAGVLTAFGSPTGTVKIGGSGDFTGRLLNSFRDPRIEGSFTGDHVRAWDVTWGRVRGQVAIENSYVDVTGGVATKGGAEIRADGRFSLGHPRKDGGEELNGRFRVTDWPLADLRHAFDLDAYPLEGKVGGEYHIYGPYTRPFGFGKATIADGSAYGEPFDLATSSLRLEGTGVRVDAAEIRKSTGAITGAAVVYWDGRYSFNADGRRIPLESVAAVRFPRAPLSGFLDFAASGSASFQSPRYGGQVRITDLFISDEGIGQVTGRVDVRERLMSLELEAGSPRLAVSGTGRIMLTPGMDAELTFRFTDTSLDPYVRVVEPRLSPFTRAVVSGTLRVVGQLANVDRLLVDGTVEQLDASLFDYKVRNDGPIRLALDRNVVRIERLRLAGTNTRLDVGGTVSLHNERIAVTAVGDANLGILQGFYRDIRSSGRAELKGEIQGPLRTPLFSGSAVITDGRIRYMGLPHSVEAINGRITFRGGGIRFDDVAATVATGKVHFGGGLEMNGYVPGQLAITATGEDMHLRYPEGFRSIVDADLALVGTFSSPTLRGTVTVKSATWSRRIDVSAGLLVGVRSSTTAPVTAAGETVPLRFDIRIQARGTLRIQNNVADIVSSADLTLRGTYEHPLLFGRAEIDRGIATFEGRRYVVTHGTVDFTNPTRIEPFFDIGAETRVRGLGQTYVVDLRIIGTISRLDPQLSSDPPLPPVDILSLLFSNATQMQDVELRALQKPNAAEQQLLGTRAAALLTSPISSGVSRAVEQTFGLDTFQITPSLGTDPYQRLEAGARVTIGKRISDKAYLTYARSLITARDYVVLLEYDQSDRLSWIMSRNEDGTYALDVRVRHTF
jgi:hypothetical protein